MVVVGSRAKAAPLQAVGNRTSHKRAAIFEDDNDAVTLGIRFNLCAFAALREIFSYSFPTRRVPGRKETRTN